MDVEEVKYVGSSKFMWDGETYDTHEAAEAKKKEYEGNKFEVLIFDQEGKSLVYTRRVVTEIVLEGDAPV